MNKLTAVLVEELEILEDAAGILKYSYNKCLKIANKKNFSDEELESFDSLTSRFARLSDIIVQKVLKVIDMIDLEAEGSVRDRINRAAKKGFVNDAEILVEIRELRNLITHEYIPEAIKTIFKQVLIMTPELLNITEKIKEYCLIKYIPTNG